MSSHDVLMLALGAYLGTSWMIAAHFTVQILDERRDRKAAAETRGAR